MLKSDTFQSLMTGKTRSTLADYQAVEQIAGSMPWFADAQILRLMLMKRHAPTKYAEMMPMLSLYAAHRRKLMEYLIKAAANGSS